MHVFMTTGIKRHWSRPISPLLSYLSGNSYRPLPSIKQYIFLCIYRSLWFNTFIPVMLQLSYLSEKRLVDLHSLIRALRQDLSPAMPAVADGRVGVGHTAQKHSPLVVELLLCFSYTLVHRHHRVIEICEREREETRGSYQLTLFHELFNWQKDVLDQSITSDHISDINRHIYTHRAVITVVNTILQDPRSSLRLKIWPKGSEFSLH